MLSFANPSFLGSKADFRKNFENAIIKGRDADATDAVKAACESKLKEIRKKVGGSRRLNNLMSYVRDLDEREKERKKKVVAAIAAGEETEEPAAFDEGSYKYPPAQIVDGVFSSFLRDHYN